MNLSSLLGTVIICFVLFFGVLRGAKNPEIFLNAHALMLVLGGTLGVTLLAFPFRKLKEMLDFLIYGLFFKKKTEDLFVVADLIRIAEEYRKDPHGFLSNYSVANPFLKEALKLLSKNALSYDDLLLIIKNRRDSFKKRYQEDHKMLLSISKFPPGLGLLGASSGMIEMMVGLNSSGMDGIGNAMAVALVATFWGIAIANFVFLPLADYAARVASEDFFTRSLVVHGISLIKQGMAPKIIAETLISQLAIRDQVYLRNIFFKSSVVGSGLASYATPPPSSSSKSEISVITMAPVFGGQKKTDQDKTNVLELPKTGSED